MSILKAYIESEGERWPGVEVRRIRGREAISSLFSFTLDLAIAADDELRGRELGPQAYPGARACIVVELDGIEARRIHGIVVSLTDRLEDDVPFRAYRVVMAPRLYETSLVETQEVFVGTTIPSLLKQKLEAHDFAEAKGQGGDFELRLGDEKIYPRREIVVQHAESDLAFIGRLTEHLGMSYFFEHDEKRDKLVITDVAYGFGSTEDAPEIPFRRKGGELGVDSLEVTTDLIPGIYFVQDYNYRAPLLDPTGQFEIEEAATSGGVVEYGSHVKTPEEATHLAKMRGQERFARHRVYDGRGSSLAISAGRIVKLLDHPRLDAGAAFLVVEAEHDMTLPVFNEVGTVEAAYSNTFRAIPADIPYRPARRTPRPRMNSVVTGIIQPGPGGEVGGIAMLDDDGRYTVQVHFDTAVHGQQKSSHAVRMAQPFAGLGNGMHFPLLPGTEVVIAFANGDPDRPVIVGALPNPGSPAPVVANEAHTHRIRSSQGVTIEFGATVPGRK